MKRSVRKLRLSGMVLVRGLGVFGLTGLVALLTATAAFASFEQVGTFGENSEKSPLASTQGVAVNSAGAGGATAGTLYVVSPFVPGVRMYDSEGKFIGQWGSVSADAVAVDQATGDVYVENGGVDDVQVYSADGSQEIASFGVIGTDHETISESPEKIHGGGGGGIAVDAAGNVYVTDYLQHVTPEESRVMVFRPQSPGDYEHYVYAGRSSDIGYTRLGEGAAYFVPGALAVDATGDLYMVSGVGDSIVEFNPGAPSTPVCSDNKVPRGGVNGIAVNPDTKQVYYYTYKDKTHIYQLECNTKGEFVQADSFAITPEVGTTAQFGHMPALAFNPVLQYQGVHPAGVLYGISEAGVGYILAPPPSRPPVVESAGAVSVTASGALLGGVVNPKGFATGYVFQYIDDAGYQANEPGERFAGAAEAPVGGGMLGGGTSGVAVEAALSGLSADTVYHYRIVAVSHCNPSDETEVCEVPGTAQAFRTFPQEAGALSDGRAYELVSPALKSGGEVFPLLFPGGGSCYECKPSINAEGYPEQASPDGEAVVYAGFPFSLTEGAQQVDEYVSRRGAGGWQTTTLSPELASRGGGYVGFDAGLGEGVLTQSNEATLSASAPVGYPNLYSRLTGAAEVGFTPLVAVQPPDRGGNTIRGAVQFQVRFAGGSADYSKLFFEANDALTGETDLAPAAVDGGQAANNLYESVDGSLRLVNVLPGNTATVPGATIGKGTGSGGSDYSHAVSADGSRVFWSDATGQVFVREDAQRTREVPDHTGRFLTAAADGSKVLLDDGHLYDLEDEQTVDLTEGHGGFLGIAGQGEDLSHVYFVDSQALTPEVQVNGHGEHAETGKNNLYAWFEGTPTFIGHLLANDENFLFIYGAWTAAPAQRSAEASPDGRWLAFLSKAPLTGYGNVGPACLRDPITKKWVKGVCTEVYLYDSATGKLVCGSCDRSGLPPLGPSHVPLLQDAPTGFEQARYLTDQGRLYFDSGDSLSPFDSNNGVEDVYQYEPGGVGDCERAEGCVNLVSSGRGAYDSNFLAADTTGKNVFFTTRDRLVAADHDGLLDLYDAREGGGIQSQGEAVQNGECQGEACQSSATGGTGQPVPSSLSFEGPGNLLVPLSPSPPKAKAKSLSRAQQLTRALSECRHKPKRKRPACERAARKRFASKAGKATKRTGKTAVKSTRGVRRGGVR